MDTITKKYELFYSKLKQCKNMDDLIYALEEYIQNFKKSKSSVNNFFKGIKHKIPVFSKYRPTDKNQLLNSISWDDQYVLFRVNNSKGHFDGFISEKKI